jgi:hypothetical protein
MTITLFACRESRNTQSWLHFSFEAWPLETRKHDVREDGTVVASEANAHVTLPAHSELKTDKHGFGMHILSWQMETVRARITMASTASDVYAFASLGVHGFRFADEVG